MDECGPLISETDLHISQLTISLLTTMCRSHPAAMSQMDKEIIIQLLLLVCQAKSHFIVLLGVSGPLYLYLASWCSGSIQYFHQYFYQVV